MIADVENEASKEEERQELECYGWEACPAELLLIIFRQLDVKSLMNCLMVNKRWCALGGHIASHTGWQTMLENGLSDQGTSYRKKSYLSCRDILKNICLWQSVKIAKPVCEHIYSEKDEINNIHIYKDNVIVSCSSQVTYIDINTHEIKKSFPEPYLDIDENDYFLAALKYVGNCKTLTVSGKQCPNSTWNDVGPQAFVIVAYKLHRNSCYISTTTNCLFCLNVYNNGRVLDLKLVARYYGHGTIVDICIHEEDIFAILDWGCLLKVDSGLMFKIGYKFDVPPVVKSIVFQNSGAVIEVHIDKPYKFKRKDKQHWMLECPALSCHLQHGDVLMLGRRNGVVDIFIPKNIDESLEPLPELSINVQDLSESPLKDKTISRIEVSEMKGTQYLFIVTRNDIHQIKLEYPPSIKNFIADLWV